MDQHRNDDDNSAEDALAALSGLSEVEQLKIARVAKMLAGFGNFASADELISEAFVRIGEGRRSWPLGVDFLPFFCKVMKSLLTDRMFLTDARKLADLRKPQTAVSGDDLDQFGAEDTREGIIQKKMLEKAASRLEEQIAGDEEMELLWMGIQDGLIGKDLEQAIGVDTQRLAALRTRLNRTIDNLADRTEAKEGLS